MSEIKPDPAAGLVPAQKTVSIAEAVQLAAEYHEAGLLAEAENICLHVLQIEPANVAAFQLLSSIAPKLSHPLPLQFFSQLGQDKYVFENYFRDRRKGVFVDIGAYDGEKFSNTLFFERYLDWSGICVEPLPSAFRKLSALRKARCFSCCLSDYEGESDFLDVDVLVDEKMLSGLVENHDPRHTARINASLQRKKIIRSPVTTLPALLRKCGIATVDYCSIDTEGSELKILRTIDFQEFEISVLSIENNYGNDEIRRIMGKNGYSLARVFHGYDELYVKNNVRPWQEPP